MDSTIDLWSGGLRFDSRLRQDLFLSFLPKWDKSEEICEGQSLCAMKIDKLVLLDFNTSRIEAHPGFFRLLMKRNFDAYVHL